MSLKLYGYRKCATSNRAEKILRDGGVDYEFNDITEKAPGIPFLKKILQGTITGKGEKGIPISKLINPSSTTYREMRMKEKLSRLGLEEILGLVASRSKMIKRPVVTDGDRFTVGLNEEEFRKAWLKS